MLLLFVLIEITWAGKAAKDDSGPGGVFVWLSALANGKCNIHTHLEKRGGKSSHSTSFHFSTSKLEGEEEAKLYVYALSLFSSKHVNQGFVTKLL